MIRRVPCPPAGIPWTGSTTAAGEYVSNSPVHIVLYLLVASLIPSMLDTENLIKYTPYLVGLLAGALLAAATLNLNRPLDGFVAGWAGYVALAMGSAVIAWERGEGAGAIIVASGIALNVGVLLAVVVSLQREQLRLLIMRMCLLIQAVSIASLLFIAVFPGRSVAQDDLSPIVRSGVPVLQSFWRNPNAMGEWALWAIASALVLEHAGTRRRTWRTLRWLYVALLILSGSRAAMIALLIFWLVQMKPSRRAIVLGTAVVTALGLYFLPNDSVLQYLKFESSFEASSGDIVRAGLLTYTLQGWLLHPFVGFGPSFYAHAIAAAGAPIDVLIAAGEVSPHNTYARTLAEVGALGFLSWACALCVVFKKARQYLRARNDKALIVLLALLVGVLVNRLFTDGLPGAMSYLNVFPTTLIVILARYPAVFGSI